MQQATLMSLPFNKIAFDIEGALIHQHGRGVKIRIESLAFTRRIEWYLEATPNESERVVGEFYYNINKGFYIDRAGIRYIQPAKWVVLNYFWSQIGYFYNPVLALEYWQRNNRFANQVGTQASDAFNLHNLIMEFWWSGIGLIAAHELLVKVIPNPLVLYPLMFVPLTLGSISGMVQKLIGRLVIRYMGDAQPKR